MSVSTESISSAVFENTITKYTAGAAITIYAYDLLLTWDDELAFFWKGEGSGLVRILFLLIRYLPLIGLSCSLMALNHFFSSQIGYALDQIDLTGTLILLGRCQVSMITSFSTQVVCVSISTAIFCARVCTIYQSKPHIRYTIMVSYWISLVCLVVFAAITMARMEPTIGYSNGSCIVDFYTGPKFQTNSITFASPLLCEIVVVLAIAKHALDTRHSRKECQRSAVSIVLRRLYLDGFLYFIVVFCFRVTCCLVWFLAPKGFKFVISFLDYAITSSLTSRFFLGLRQSLVRSNLVKYSSDTAVNTDTLDKVSYLSDSRVQPETAIISSIHYMLQSLSLGSMTNSIDEP